MRITLVTSGELPAREYGGIERVVWWLAKRLSELGHSVVLIADAVGACGFAEARRRRRDLELGAQIPADADLVHFHHPFRGSLEQPYVVTIHGNGKPGARLDRNAVFLSSDHARRHGSRTFVHNGLDPAEYGAPPFAAPADYVHFLGKAAWRVKNVRGAIRIAREAGVPLEVLGGGRFNLNMGFRLTLDRNVSFHGMVGGAEKNRLLGGSRGLIFPVLWHEPFGLAVIESLYFGCPVVGTPYGALPELVPPEVGFLSARFGELVQAVREIERFDRRRCHEWVLENFTAATMTSRYLALYERVLDGEVLNPDEPTARAAEPCKLL